MDFRKFVFYSFVGSVPWTFMLAYVGYWLGPEWVSIKGVFRGLDVVVVLAVVLVIVWYFYRLRKRYSKPEPVQP
jgi:membrane protein DedA with SNARE-associated domain